MVYRIYSEKKPRLSSHAASLCADIRSSLGIPSLEKIRVLHRYDAEAPTLPEAIKNAYSIADSITFENKYMRRDIGKRALSALKD